MDIMVKELAPIVISSAVWGPHLARRRVLIQCDNLSLVTAVQKGYSKHPNVMHLLRSLWFFIAIYDIDLVIEHIAGVNNSAADMLSRNNITEFFSLCPQVSRLPTQLWSSVQKYFEQSVATSTRDTYAIGQNRFLGFCHEIQRQPLPASETTLLLFVSHLATISLSHSTIKVYLAAVRHMHMTQGKYTEF